MIRCTTSSTRSEAVAMQGSSGTHRNKQARFLRRLTEHRERQIHENQAGFRPARGCIDHIFTLRLILEQRHCFQQPTMVVFLDLKAAFDSVDRQALWQSAMPLEGSTRAWILQGCPNLDRSREAEVGFETRTFQSVNLRSNQIEISEAEVPR
ncbi:hypothetical protein T265_04308 [Opisthorchis viverrini]|uniref:Reverse transcriptase domain-containing protein n=1 Tax=Opisthorchis viverrini TaxID=6198 RepID=A0A075A0D5_OPIVI|nr:hypothetical protein T265_04308 [Opisthorchis viverrini]KER29020.1 hypothetical protein T265_04308 [Opisthorchis viverrini]